MEQKVVTVFETFFNTSVGKFVDYDKILADNGLEGWTIKQITSTSLELADDMIAVAVTLLLERH